MSAPTLSPSVHRALYQPRPVWRGRTHTWAAVLSYPAGVALIAGADPGRGRAAAALFAASVCFMFTASATVHWRRWSVETYERLFRVDHTAIFGLIIGTAAPVAHAMGGIAGQVLFIGILAGGTVAVASVWMPFHPPRGLMNGLFITLGWLPILVTPRLIDALGWDGFGLIAAGGFLYTVGAVIVGTQRPDPNPLRFGYHEIWHLLVIGGVGLHYWAIGAYAL